MKKDRSNHQQQQLLPLAASEATAVSIVVTISLSGAV
jgi:hypothetical protein